MVGGEVDSGVCGVCDGGAGGGASVRVCGGEEGEGV